MRGISSFNLYYIAIHNFYFWRGRIFKSIYCFYLVWVLFSTLFVKCVSPRSHAVSSLLVTIVFFLQVPSLQEEGHTTRKDTPDNIAPALWRFLRRQVERKPWKMGERAVCQKGEKCFAEKKKKDPEVENMKTKRS